MKALDEYREKFVDRYVENYAMLARIIRVEADVKHSTATPRTVDEGGQTGTMSRYVTGQLGFVPRPGFLDKRSNREPIH